MNLFNDKPNFKPLIIGGIILVFFIIPLIVIGVQYSTRSIDRNINKIRYQVIGDIDSTEVSFMDEFNQKRIFRVGLPWNYEYRAEHGRILYIGANPGPIPCHVEVRIFFNDRLVKASDTRETAGIIAAKVEI